MTTKLTMLDAGYCTHPEYIVIRGGAISSCQFPAMFGLIEHPQLGNILFDTGYTEHFHTETQTLPNKLYAWLTPVHLKPEETAKQQLEQRGISDEKVNLIIISHFHSDHIAGLQDFPNARILCAQEAYQSIQKKKGLQAVIKGFLPGLLPRNIQDRLQFLKDYPRISLPPELLPFKSAYSLTADESLLVVELPGHAAGHIGLIVRIDERQVFFLIGDACWVSGNYQQLRMPHPVTRLFHTDYAAYQNTVQMLHQLSQSNPWIKIVPAHCSEVNAELRGKTYAPIH